MTAFFRLLLLLLFITITSLVTAFMPNYVFWFRPPNSSLDPELFLLPEVEIATTGFLPSDFHPVEEAEGPLRDGSWTHKDIIRRACLNVVARFYEETTPRLASGDVTGLSTLTPTSLLRAVIGPDASSAKFERALEEIEIAAARMDQWYEVNATLDEAANVARAHFDDEQFRLGHQYLLRLRRQMFAAVQKEALSAARDLAGRFMLTLQDFYAHSNYVELNRTEPLEELGRTAQASFLNQVAGADEAVCTDCTVSCETNVVTMKLTSGYFFYPTDSVNYGGGTGIGRVKPTGKCSYGGEVDQSSQLSAVGGINKSTRNERKSPHFHLHESAAQLAIKATETFLEDIRAVVGDDAFLRFFSLGRTVGGASLCFVIDQSGSMGDDIAAAKEQAKKIVQTTTTQPFNYVLVQFNDPDFGPAIVTKDPDAFITELDKLFASGGGDCPELAMSGIQLALTNCLPGSSLYVFTDAGAKDCDKTNAVLSLIDSKGTTVYFFYTGGGIPCGSCPNAFKEIATLSGGQLLRISKDSVESATQLTESTAASSLVVLLSATSSASTESYSFSVDCTVRKLVISLDGPNPAATIVQPDGTAFTSFDELLLENFLLINITDPAVGQWTLSASFSGEHSIIVRASSSVDFSFNFVTVAGRPGHLGVFPINGRPVVNTLTKVVLTVKGIDETSDVHGFMVDLIDREGNAIETHEPERGVNSSANLLGFAFISPTTPFRLRLRGQNSCDGTDFARVSPIETTAQTLTFESTFSEFENVIAPGGFTETSFVLYNSGETDIITLTYNDDQGFGETITVTITGEPSKKRRRRRRRRRGLSTIEHTFTLEANQSALVSVRYGAPSSAAVGQSNTATLTATTSGGDTFNYVSLEVVVATDEPDEEPPTCRIVDVTTCDGVAAVDCDAHERTVRAEVRDVGVGLQTIRARQSGVDVEFDFASGTNETVSVTATSSCCYLVIDLESSDVAGNLQSVNCSAVISPGVPNDIIGLLGILIPDGMDNITAAGIVQIVVKDWKTIHYSVNVTGVEARTFRLSETRNGGVGDPLFTVAGFNYGNVLSGSLLADGSYLPIIYQKTAYGTVQYISDGIEKSIGGPILYANLSSVPHFEALLTCRNRCAAGGYVALTLDDFSSTLTVDGLNAMYYLLVGGENVSTAHVVNSSGDVVAQMESSSGQGVFQLSMNELNHLLSDELTVIVNTRSGIVLTGRLRAPWMPTPAPSPATSTSASSPASLTSTPTPAAPTTSASSPASLTSTPTPAAPTTSASSPASLTSTPTPAAPTTSASSPAAPTTSAPTSAPQGIDFGNGVGINDKITFVEEQAVGIHITSRPHRIFVHTPQGDSIKECTVRLSAEFASLLDDEEYVYVVDSKKVPHGITYSVGSSGKSLTFRGIASASAYASALQRIYYANIAEEPRIVVNTTSNAKIRRQIVIELVSNDSSISVIGVVDVDVVPVNDHAPVLSIGTMGDCVSVAGPRVRSRRSESRDDKESRTSGFVSTEAAPQVLLVELVSPPLGSFGVAGSSIVIHFSSETNMPGLLGKNRLERVLAVRGIDAQRSDIIAEWQDSQSLLLIFPKALSKVVADDLAVAFIGGGCDTGDCVNSICRRGGRSCSVGGVHKPTAFKPF